ncbi:MAG: hypothetical protein Kow0074_12570 [Candidatus Zixiibacteriota bacterium]
MTRHQSVGTCASVMAILLTLAGCAPYSFSGGRTALVQSIHVPVFENETTEFGLAEQLTEGIINGFVEDNQVQILAAGTAEATLNGRITDYQRKAYTFDETDQVSEYIVEIWVDAELTKRDGTGAVWTQKGLRGFGVYPADGEETEGQRLAIEKITEDIINLTIRSW